MKKLQRILDSKPLLSRAFGRGDDLRRIANEPPTVSVIDTEQLGPGHRPLVVTEGVSSDDRERRYVFEPLRLPIFGTGSSDERHEASGARNECALSQVATIASVLEPETRLRPRPEAGH